MFPDIGRGWHVQRQRSILPHTLCIDVILDFKSTRKVKEVLSRSYLGPMRQDVASFVDCAAG